MKEKIKEKVSGEKKEDEDTSVPVEKCEEEEKFTETVTVVTHEEPSTYQSDEEKKGFLEKIKEKLPGGGKKADQDHVAPLPPLPAAPEVHCHEGETAAKEKKGIFVKIKEKLPGYHPKEGGEKETDETTH